VTDKVAVERGRIRKESDAALSLPAGRVTVAEAVGC
jgi:hypothetical protein